jgi:hypothetical protein
MFQARKTMMMRKSCSLNNGWQGYENFHVTTAGDITCYYSHYVMFVEWLGSDWISSGGAYGGRCLLQSYDFPTLAATVVLKSAE